MTTVQITGLAATGAAIANATVTATNAKGEKATAVTSAAGAYTINIADAAPFVLSVTDAAGKAWYSFAQAAGVANITPLTTMAYTYAFGSGAPVSHAAFTTQAQTLATQFGLSGVNLATTLPQVTGTTNAYGDSLRALSRYMADNNRTLATITNAAFANAGDLTAFNTLYNNALIAVGSPVRVNFTATGFNLAGTGAGGGSGTCGVNVQGTVTANGFTVPLNVNYCVTGIAAGSCTSGNSSLSQALGGQQGIVGAANLQYAFSASCAAGAFTINLQ